jgi:hypothetical protein
MSSGGRRDPPAKSDVCNGVHPRYYAGLTLKLKNLQASGGFLRIGIRGFIQRTMFLYFIMEYL